MKAVFFNGTSPQEGWPVVLCIDGNYVKLDKKKLLLDKNIPPPIKSGRIHDIFLSDTFVDGKPYQSVTKELRPAIGIPNIALLLTGKVISGTGTLFNKSGYNHIYILPQHTFVQIEWNNQIFALINKDGELEKSLSRRQPSEKFQQSKVPPFERRHPRR